MTEIEQRGHAVHAFASQILDIAPSDASVAIAGGLAACAAISIEAGIESVSLYEALAACIAAARRKRDEQTPATIRGGKDGEV